jgi:hypothetical protein
MRHHAQQAYYRGTLFRSTLEARWAAYFDEIACPWKYEPGQAKFRDVVWTPDFVIGTDYRLVVECKGAHLWRIEKVAKFVRATGRPVLIALSEGRFVYCQPERFHEDHELLDAILKCDELGLSYASKYRASLRLDENLRYVGFSNNGDACDVYTGTAPDFSDSFKDAGDPWGGDVRSWYYGGYSTWVQRGFDPASVRIRTKPRPRSRNPMAGIEAIRKIIEEAKPV